MDNTSQEDPPAIITLDANGIDHLAGIQKWTKIISTIGFVFLGFIVLGTAIGVFMISSTRGGNYAILSIIPLLLISLVYYFPIRYLWKFSKGAKAAIEFNDTESLGNALEYLKKHYRFMGILMIVAAIVYAVAGINALLEANL